MKQKREQMKNEVLNYLENLAVVATHLEQSLLDTNSGLTLLNEQYYNVNNRVLTKSIVNSVLDILETRKAWGIKGELQYHSNLSSLKEGLHKECLDRAFIVQVSRTLHDLIIELADSVREGIFTGIVSAFNNVASEKYSTDSLSTLMSGITKSKLSTLVADKGRLSWIPLALGASVHGYTQEVLLEKVQALVAQLSIKDTSKVDLPYLAELVEEFNSILDEIKDTVLYLNSAITDYRKSPEFYVEFMLRGNKLDDFMQSVRTDTTKELLNAFSGRVTTPTPSNKTELYESIGKVRSSLRPTLLIRALISEGYHSIERPSEDIAKTHLSFVRYYSLLGKVLQVMQPTTSLTEISILARKKLDRLFSTPSLEVRREGDARLNFFMTNAMEAVSKAKEEQSVYTNTLLQDDPYNEGVWLYCVLLREYFNTLGRVLKTRHIGDGILVTAYTSFIKDLDPAILGRQTFNFIEPFSSILVKKYLTQLLDFPKDAKMRTMLSVTSSDLNYELMVTRTTVESARETLASISNENCRHAEVENEIIDAEVTKYLIRNLNK